MTTTSDWAVNTIQTATVNGVQNAVAKVGFIANYRNNNMNHGIIGEVVLGQPDPNNFINFSSLSPDVIFGWVKDALGQTKLEEMQAEAQAYFDGFNVEQPEYQNLPWAAVATLKTPSVNLPV